jgi:hypothetical protein
MWDTHHIRVGLIWGQVAKNRIELITKRVQVNLPDNIK